VTHNDPPDERERTAAAMHATAAQLEVAEDILHGSAEQSPNEETTARLHALGDDVTAQAKLIDRRADRLSGERSPAEEDSRTTPQRSRK
jgi:hypothetical protein